MYLSRRAKAGDIIRDSVGVTQEKRPLELPVNQLPPSLADFARRLLQHEVGNSGSAGDLVAAFERACQALHSRMAPLISPAGFGALIERAVKLAARDFPFLGGTNAPVAANCSVDGLRHVAEGREPAEVADALAAILANFIWLVVIFIGENLGLRKVREVWPNVPFAAPGSSPEKAPQ